MNEWLENLYEMCSSNSIESIDVVYDKIDDLLEDKNILRLMHFLY